MNHDICQRRYAYYLTTEIQMQNNSVVVIPSWYPPRGGSFFREHAKALAGAGMVVFVLAPVEAGLRDTPLANLFSCKPEVTHPEGRFTETVQKVRRIPLLGKHNVKRWVNHACRMYQHHAAVHGHPCLIHVHSSMWAGLAAAHIKERYGVPYLITEHRGRFTNTHPLAQSLIKEWHKPLLEKAFSMADHIVLVSKALSKGVRCFCPDGEDKISVIPNMVDAAFFTPPDLKPSAQKNFTFICVASMEEVKGVDLLIKAFAMIREQSPRNLRLIIAGDGPMLHQLQKICRERQIDDKVSFTGRLSREELRRQLQHANAFVLPSRFEAFGIVLIEAMACGLPLIATRSGGPEEIVTPGSGYLVPAEDPTALASAMQQMITQHNRFDSSSIRQRAVDHYSKEVIASSYASLYNLYYSCFKFRSDARRRKSPI